MGLAHGVFLVVGTPVLSLLATPDSGCGLSVGHLRYDTRPVESSLS